MGVFVLKALKAESSVKMILSSVAIASAFGVSALGAVKYREKKEKREKERGAPPNNFPIWAGKH